MPFNPNSIPFTPERPIDKAMDEINVLKSELLQLRKELEPLIEERNKRLVEEERDKPVVVEKSWWY